MKTNKQFIDEIYQKYDECQKEKKQRKQQKMKKFLNMAAVMVVALSTIICPTPDFKAYCNSSSVLLLPWNNMFLGSKPTDSAV